MDAVETLITQYSLPSLVLAIILILIAIKFLSELISWFYDKIKKRIFKETSQEEREKSQDERLEDYFDYADKHFEKMNKRFDYIDEQIAITHDNQETTNKRLTFIEERQQENTRSFLIDSHHKFCYEIGTIDDLSLESIERRYMYYKTAGGDSFIDNLVAEIRALPHAHLPKAEDHSETLVPETRREEVP